MPFGGSLKPRRRDRTKLAASIRLKEELSESVRAKLARFTKPKINYLLLLAAFLLIQTQVALHFASALQQEGAASATQNLPDLTSGTSDEPIVAVVGQDAFISCIAKRLQNYTIIWRFTNDANAPAISSLENANESNKPSDQLGAILTAGKQRVINDDRISVIQSDHETWLLKISNLRLTDTGTYIWHTNSEPKVRVLRVLSVIRPSANNVGPLRAGQETDAEGK